MQPAIAANSNAAPNHAAARRPIWSTPRAVAKKKPQITAGTSAATDASPKNCMADVGDHRAGIAHRVGDRIVGGVAEARIVDIPGAQRGERESDACQQRHAGGPAGLPAREGAKAAIVVVGQMESAESPERMPQTP